MKISVRARHIRTMAGIAVLTAVCSGCGDDNISTPPMVTKPAATTAEPKTLEERAIERAKPVIFQYYQVSNSALRDPQNFDSERFKSIAEGSALVDAQNLLAIVRAQNQHQVGNTKVISIKAPRVDLRNNPKLSPPDIPSVIFDVCWDASTVQIVDKENRPAPTEDHPSRGVERVGVGNYDYPYGAWKVLFTEYQKGKTC